MAEAATLAVPARGAAAAYRPLYQQIKDLLVKGLDDGEWRPGEAIPSEQELAQRFGVSQGTVRKAIEDLVAANLLLRRQGKGTFVATHHEARVRFRFLRLSADDGQPPVTQSRIIDCRRLRAPADVAALLSLAPSDPVVNLRRQLSFDGRPTILDDIWLPGQLFRGLTADSIAQYHGPLYGLFETRFGINMVRGEEKLRAIVADDLHAQWLEVAPGTPLLSVERLAYTYGDRVVELRRGSYLTESFHYRNSLN